MAKRAVVPSGIGNSISVPIPLAAKGSPGATVANFSRIIVLSSRKNSPRNGCTQRTAPALPAGAEVASHSHYVMDDVYHTPYWKDHVLPGWIVGTAGAVRYRLPPGRTGSSIARTDVYGYLLATVLS